MYIHIYVSFFSHSTILIFLLGIFLFYSLVNHPLAFVFSSFMIIIGLLLFSLISTLVQATKNEQQNQCTTEKRYNETNQDVNTSFSSNNNISDKNSSSSSCGNNSSSSQCKFTEGSVILFYFCFFYLLII